MLPDQKVQTKLWISWERKKLLKWNKKHFSSFLKDFQLPNFVSHLRGKWSNKCLFVRRQPGPIKSVLLVITGWLFGWLVGNTVFSETALRVFLIFCMKLGDYKGRKVKKPDFSKKFLMWRYSRKSLQISPKSDTFIFLSKTAPTTFLVFGLKSVLNMTIWMKSTFQKNL